MGKQFGPVIEGAWLNSISFSVNNEIHDPVHATAGFTHVITLRYRLTDQGGADVHMDQIETLQFGSTNRLSVKEILDLLSDKRSDIDGAVAATKERLTGYKMDGEMGA